MAVALALRETAPPATTCSTAWPPTPGFALDRADARRACWPTRSPFVGAAGRPGGRLRRAAVAEVVAAPPRGRRLPPRARSSDRADLQDLGRPAATSTSPTSHSGKVRDIYDVGDDRLLMVTSDRMSAFDVVMDEPIPHKGRVLTAMSAFWFEQLGDVAAHHLISTDLADLPDGVAAARRWPGRVMLCRKAEMLPIECIVRGYLTGLGVEGVPARTGTMHGTPLPAGLQESRPAARAGVHAVDQGRGGRPRREHLLRAGRRARRRGAGRARPATSRSSSTAGAPSWAAERGHHHRRHQVRARAGRRRAGRCATRCSRPTRRRFWPADEWKPGHDAAALRQAAGARLPRAPSTGTRRRRRRRCRDEVVAATRDRYIEAYERITGRSLRRLAGLPVSRAARPGSQGGASPMGPPGRVQPCASTGVPTGCGRSSPVAAVVVIVDVLSFTTSVSVAVGRGPRCCPTGGRTRAARRSPLGTAPCSPPGGRARASAVDAVAVDLVELPAGTRLVLPSPNGSALSFAARRAGARAVLAGCLRNAQAVAAPRPPPPVSASGSWPWSPRVERWRGQTGSLRPSVEDLVGAGAVLHALPGALTPSPEAAAADAAFAAWATCPPRCTTASAAGS